MTHKLAGLLLALALAAPAGALRAQDSTSCADFDSDNDGFSDAVECAGITTLGTPDPNEPTRVIGQRFFPRCTTGMAREQCVDPNSRDLFVAVVPTPTGSLLIGNVPTAIANPFAQQTVYGLTFTGLTSLGLNVHVLDATNLPIDLRTVTSGSTQRAIVVYEDLDPSDLNTLAYCPYGRPNGPAENVCIVYTRRIVDAIALACGQLPIVTPGGAESNATEAFKAYTIEMFLHEVGHSIGGLTASFNSRYGGYHYTSGTVMEQFVVASTTKGKCRVYVSNQFNNRLDPSAVILK